MINIDTSVKNIIYVEKVIFGILLYVVAKMENNQHLKNKWKTIQGLRDVKLQTKKKKNNYNKF